MAALPRALPPASPPGPPATPVYRYERHPGPAALIDQLRIPHRSGSAANRSWPRARCPPKRLDGLGERLDPGVVVRGAPDQPERQRWHIRDGNKADVVAGEHRYPCRGRVDDAALP